MERKPSSEITRKRVQFCECIMLVKWFYRHKDWSRTQRLEAIMSLLILACVPNTNLIILTNSPMVTWSGTRYLRFSIIGSCFSPLNRSMINGTLFGWDNLIVSESLLRSAVDEIKIFGWIGCCNLLSVCEYSTQLANQVYLYASKLTECSHLLKTSRCGRHCDQLIDLLLSGKSWILYKLIIIKILII